MITVTVTDIDWDLTGDNDGEFDGNEIEYRDHLNDEYANGRQYTLDCDDDPDCITKELSDILSDRSGWCMHSIDWDKTEGDTSKYRSERREDNPHPEARVYDDDNREYANDDRDDYYEETDRIECVECGNDCDPEDVDENTGRCDRCSVSVSRNPETRPLHIIAAEITKDWKNPYFGAVPYIQAMSSLSSIKEMYGADKASDVVLYFLSNATSWRGETAKRVKSELREIAREVYPWMKRNPSSGEKQRARSVRDFPSLKVPPAKRFDSHSKYMLETEKWRKGNTPAENGWKPTNADRKKYHNMILDMAKVSRPILPNPRKIPLREFIKENRAEIDAAIRSVSDNCRLNDAERERWIRNDEGLYLWARRSGANI